PFQDVQSSFFWEKPEQGGTQARLFVVICEKRSRKGHTLWSNNSSAFLSRRYDTWLKTTSRLRRSTPPGKSTRITSKQRLRRSPSRSSSCAPHLTCAPSARMPCTSSAAELSGSPISWAKTVIRR